MGGIARKYWRVFIFLTLVSLMAFAPGVKQAKAEGETAPPIKIMPLGDSITTSLLDFSSYRCYLDHLLDTAGVSFDFVGTQTTNYNGNNPPCGDPPTDFDHNHEAHSGAMAWDFLHEDNWGGTPKYTIDYILSQNVPDMVLIHLGTNDVFKAHSTEQIISDLGSIIDHIRAANPDVVILLAQIIPCSGLSQCGQIPALNAQIPALAAQKNTLFAPVIAVDQYTGYDVFNDNWYNSTLKEYVHPNSSGDAKMAARWIAAIQTYLNRTISQVFIPVTMK